VATTSIFTVSSPRGVPDVLSFERRCPLGVTTAPVPVCLAVVLFTVLRCVVDPQPAAAARVAPSATAIERALTAPSYPTAMTG
jgi:hypothetical protein